MIGREQVNKLAILCKGTLALKPLTEYGKFVGIIILPIKDKNDCEQSRFYLKVVREMGVLQFVVVLALLTTKKKLVKIRIFLNRQLITPYFLYFCI